MTFDPRKNIKSRRLGYLDPVKITPFDLDILPLKYNAPSQIEDIFRPKSQMEFGLRIGRLRRLVHSIDYPYQAELRK